MAVTHKAIVSMFMTRRGGIEAIAVRYRLTAEYVEDCLRYRIDGKKPRKATTYRKYPEQPQMTIAERYGTISI